MVEALMNQVGLQSTDERVFKLISVLAEAQLCKILSEVKSVNLQQLKPNEGPKTHISHEELSKGLEEFGIAIRRPQFLEDRSKGNRR